MKRVVIKYMDGEVETYKCTSASYGHQSHNLILAGVVNPDTGRKIADYVSVTLTNVKSFFEVQW